MTIPKIKNGIDKQSDADLLSYTLSIHQSISSRTSVFATPTPTMPAYKELIDEFQASLLAAASGDRVAISQKNQSRDALELQTHILSYYVLLTAKGDAHIIRESGFQLTKTREPRHITKPTGLKVTNSDQTGELLVSVKKVAGAASYMHQYTTDPELKEESWMSMNCTSKKCLIKGLTPGTTYFIRVGAVGTKDQVLYSDVVSRKAA